MPTPRFWPPPLRAAFRLRCPRCGEGRLFAGWFRMEPGCLRCGLDFRREPGFYLGSIYINYGITALSTITLYGLLVLWAGWSAEQALAACLAVAVALPMWLFRYARAFLLAIDSSVNREPAGAAGPAADGSLSEAQLSSHRANDGQAGCAMGIALALVLLFGLVMAGVSLWFAIESGSEGWRDGEPSEMEPAN
jgi:uncharacterized protein (DUF983 family)